MIYYSSYMALLVVFSLLEMENPNSIHLKRILLSISSIVTIVLVGLRKEVGGDWFTYLRYHERGYATPFIEFIQMNDPAYMAISWLLGRFGLGVWSLNLFVAAIFVFGLYALALRLRYSNLFFLSAAPYLIIVVGMGYTRQSAAIGILCFSIACLFLQRRYKAVGFGSTSLLFHKSAIFALLPILLSANSSRWKNIAIIVLGLPLIVLFVLLEALEVAQSGYIDAEYSSAGAMIRVLQIFICGIGARIFLLRYEGLERKRLLSIFSIMAILSLPALLISPSSTLIDRLILYLLPFQCYVLARVPDLLSHGGSRIFGCLLVIFINCLIFFIWITSAVNLESWINYKNYIW